MDIEEAKKTVKRMQEVIFRIMCDIDDFCKENGIRYYLSGGTCLGAVRHQGFIPWDDDADLMMPRPDYERFLQTFPKAYEKKYFVGSTKTTDHWLRTFARVCDVNSRITHRCFEETTGIFVDIFPIDGLPNAAYLRKLHYKRVHLLYVIRNTCVGRQGFNENEKYRWLKKSIGLITNRIGPEFFSRRIEHYATRHKFDNSRYVGVAVIIHYGIRETIEREYMEKAAVQCFEGKEFPVPVGYEQYLKNLYGNYMIIPEGAEEKGYTHLANWKVEFDVAAGNAK